MGKFLKNIKDYVKIGKTPFIISIAGGSGSGKTFIANLIAEKLNAEVLTMDDYIIPEKIKSSENWDSSDNWNLELLKEHLIKLKKKEKIKKPIYNFKKQSNSTFEDFSLKR